MATFGRKVSDFFGLTPSDDEGAFDDERYDDLDQREDSRYGSSYRDEREERGVSRGQRRYELREESAREDMRDLDRDNERPSYSSRMRPLENPEPAQQVFIKPESDFRDRYSKAPEIGRHFRDGDIVTFDLSALDPAEQKRYLDFAAGLAFALRGRIRPDGSVITLIPEGVSASEISSERLSS